MISDVLIHAGSDEMDTPGGPINRELIGRAEAIDSTQRVVLDIDSCGLESGCCCCRVKTEERSRGGEVSAGNRVSLPVGSRVQR